MKLRILDGTPPEARHLCLDCRRAVRMIQGGRERTFCEALPPPYAEIRGRVSACSSYLSTADQLAFSRYSSQAWHMDMDEDGPVWTTPAQRESPNGFRVSVRRNPRGRRRKAVEADFSNPGRVN